MRKHMQFFKSMILATLLYTGFAAGSIAQDTTTINNPETKAPVIEATTPSGGEDTVDLRSVIEITFSSEMDEATINGSTLLLHVSSSDSMHEMHGEMQENQIKDRSEIRDTENRWQHTSNAVNGTISYSGKVAVFVPDMELQEDAIYTFTVTSDVKSQDDIALDKDYSWSFTTKETSNKSYTNAQNANHGTDRFGMDRRDRHEHSKRSSDTIRKDKKDMIDLGKAGQFVIFAKTTINNESESMITGRTGEGSVTDKSNGDSKIDKTKTDEAKTEKAFTDSVRQSTSNQVLILQSNRGDTTSPQSETTSAATDVSEAIEDLMSAFSDASMQNGDDGAIHKNGSFHDTMLSSGIHKWSNSLHLEYDVTLSGREDDVWLFKVGSDLMIDENIVITLTDGARADNVFWYVEGEVTIGKNAQFEGIILSMNEITLDKSAKLNGRMFSQSSITLDDNTINEPSIMTVQRTSTNR